MEMIENVNRFLLTLSNMDLRKEFAHATNIVLSIFLDTTNFYLHSNPLCMNGSTVPYSMLSRKIGLVIDALFCVNYSIWKHLFFEIIESLFQNIRQGTESHIFQMQHPILKGRYCRFFLLELHANVICDCQSNM